MHFYCDLKNLRETVNRVSFFISPKSTIPALEGIMIECKGNNLTLKGYDLEIGIQKSIEVEGTKDGSIVLNAQLFGEILRKMKEEKIELFCDEKMLTLIKGSNTEFHILGMDKDEFPDLPQMNENKSFQLKDIDLKRMIDQTLFSASLSTQTPVLNGALFELKEGVLSAAAVDGYRVAVSRTKMDSLKECRCIIPSKALNELSKLLSDKEDYETVIQVGEKHTSFQVDGYYIIARQLEGEFIDYNNAVPKENKTTLCADVQQLTQSIERISIMINIKNKTPVKMNLDKNTVYLSCESTLGKVNDRFDAQIKGESVKIAYNNRYMIEALKHSHCEEVLIQFDGPLSPISITPLEGSEFLFLVLPVRLKADE